MSISSLRALKYKVFHLVVIFFLTRVKPIFHIRNVSSTQLLFQISNWNRHSVIVSRFYSLCEKIPNVSRRDREREKGEWKGRGGTGSRVMGKRDSPRATMQMEARHFRIASRRNLPGTEWDGTGRYSAEKRKVPEFRKNRPGKFWSGLEGKPGRKRRRVEILVLSRRYKSLAESAQSRTRWIARCSFRTISRFFASLPFPFFSRSHILEFLPFFCSLSSLFSRSLIFCSSPLI